MRESSLSMNNLRRSLEGSFCAVEVRGPRRAGGGKSPADREACNRVKRVLDGVELASLGDFGLMSSS